MDNQHEPETPIFEDYTKENQDFMQNPTDFSDPVAQERRSKIMKRIALSLGAIALIMALAYGTYYLLHKDNGESTPRGDSTPTATATAPKGAIVTPLTKQYPGAPKAKEGPSTITISKEGTAQDSAGNILTVNGKKIYNPSENCTVSQATDFCLTGLIHDNTEIDVYYLKDAVHSRLFPDNKDYTPLKIQGSPAAGALPMDIAGEKRSAIAIANKDSSGWMLVVKKGDVNQIASLASVK